MLYGKTKKCCVGDCEKNATTWNGFLIKSRDKIEAGFCEAHKNIEHINYLGKKNCFGIYNKMLGEIYKK